MIISTYILEKLPFIDANNIKINPELFDFLQFFASHSCSLLPKIMVKINIISMKVFDLLVMSRNAVFGVSFISTILDA